MAEQSPSQNQIFQTGPSQAKARPNFSKEKAWISLDSLVRNEPFQWVIVTPRAKKVFALARFPELNVQMPGIF
jgi:hypothetical protein